MRATSFWFCLFIILKFGSSETLLECGSADVHLNTQVSIIQPLYGLPIPRSPGQEQPPFVAISIRSPTPPTTNAKVTLNLDLVMNLPLNALLPILTVGGCPFGLPISSSSGYMHDVPTASGYGVSYTSYYVTWKPSANYQLVNSTRYTLFLDASTFNVTSASWLVVLTGDNFNVTASINQTSGVTVSACDLSLYYGGDCAAELDSQYRCPVTDAKIRSACKEVLSGCFDGDAIVQSQSGAGITMKELQVGEFVLSQSWPRRFSRVVTFLERDTDALVEFLEIHFQRESGEDTSSGSIRISAKHLMKAQAQPRASDSWAYLTADRVHVGMQLSGAAGDRAIVTSVRKISRVGYFLPLTESGTLVVSGIEVSCYGNSLNGLSHQQQHVLYLPLRVLASLYPSVVESYSEMHWYLRGLYRLRKAFSSLIDIESLYQYTAHLLSIK